ncbi:MAG: hypothetical protein K2Z25_26180 [Beijerinckiaceae bacterium]|nr:hypothetical protein [Beijerinckiaceae bacterium]
MVAYWLQAKLGLGIMVFLMAEIMTARTDVTVVDAANLCGKNTNARITVAAIAGK